MMLRAKRITPAGWMRVRRELSGRHLRAVKANDEELADLFMEIRSDLSRHSRSSTILEEIPRSAGELSGFPVTHGLRRGLYSCAASRLLVTNDPRATLGREPHCNCVFNSASKFSA